MSWSVNGGTQDYPTSPLMNCNKALWKLPLCQIYCFYCDKYILLIKPAAKGPNGVILFSVASRCQWRNYVNECKVVPSKPQEPKQVCTSVAYHSIHSWWLFAIWTTHRTLQKATLWNSHFKGEYIFARTFRQIQITSTTRRYSQILKSDFSSTTTCSFWMNLG